jgi:sarcosine oxidase
VVVVGAGAFGGWTALYLQRLGARVELIDAHGPGNSRSSSGGETRLIRADHGDRLEYMRLAMAAYTRWLEWQEEWDESLLLPTDRLVAAWRRSCPRRRGGATCCSRTACPPKC